MLNHHTIRTDEFEKILEMQLDELLEKCKRIKKKEDAERFEKLKTEFLTLIKERLEYYSSY